VKLTVVVGDVALAPEVEDLTEGKAVGCDGELAWEVGGSGHRRA
jgi:hypothetical protein